MTDALPTLPPMSDVIELADGRLVENGVVRDHLKTDTTRPFVSGKLARHLHGVREVIRSVREGAEPECPAAKLLGISAGGLTVRCAVERSLVTEQGDPSTLGSFCLCSAATRNGGYTACPTWQREKERVWASRRAEVGEQEGV